MNKLYNGNSAEELKKLDSNSVDLICTDPPYGYDFMGKDWDKAVVGREVWDECYRVLKPGAFAFVMSATRSDVQYRMIQKLEESGFRIDFTPIYWAYSSGFPKAYNMGQSAEKKLTIGKARRPDRDLGKLTRNRWSGQQDGKLFTNSGGKIELTQPESKKLEKAFGGFQPKPAVEVIIVAMKPMTEKTYVEQALKNSKGVTWMGDCRIPDNEGGDRFMSNLIVQDNYMGDYSKYFDLDSWWKERFDMLPSKQTYPFLYVKKPNKKEKELGLENHKKGVGGAYLGNVDEKNNNSLGGNPSRKIIPRSNIHPTVKPIELMSYLILLGSRENDVVLDPFLGSGTTAISCVLNDRQYIGIELNSEYYDISKSRIEHWNSSENETIEKFF